MTKIVREPVKSSQVVAIGWDAPTKQMDVEYQHSGDVYRYQNVSAELHQQIMGAQSIGRAINQTLKKNPKAYPYVKLTKEQAAL